MAAEREVTQLQFQMLVKNSYLSVTNRLMTHLLESNRDYVTRMIDEDF